ncbi:hypothetical protein JHL18_04490 [Clostridium sp. YIM B02505]|uniref:Transmembrane protein n=1 Tax=Clostridium yunnanense TaxID=2800325 RepID=A0ABS1EKK1_9CLOT|nr:hypothetical protein [Clostridium yunnanense]MBK1809898.1 hypothetical protein [Clostridium yunnanense]
MEQLTLFIITWLLLFIIVPLERIKELRYVAVVSIVWMIFVDNISAYLGYYSYEHILIPIGRASLFQLLALAGLGILMINWVEESSLSKLMPVLIVSLLFLIVQQIYIQTGAFTYGTFDMMLSFIHSTAALSIFMWISLAVVGEETVYYSDKKTRKSASKQ